MASMTFPAKRGAPGAPFGMMLLVLGVYLLTMSGHTYAIDEETMRAASSSFIQSGSWSLPESNEFVEVKGVDGKFYSIFGLGQSLAAIPWVAVGRFIGGFFPPDQAGFPLLLVLGSYNALIGAGICGLFVAVGVLLGFSRRACLFVAGVLAFATFFWPHSRTFFAEPLVCLCLFAAFYLLLLSRSASRIGGPRRNWLLLLASGVLFAFAITTKVQYIEALPAYLVYLAWPQLTSWHLSQRLFGRHVLLERPKPSEQGERDSAGAIQGRFQLLWWLGGLILGLVPLFAYNWLLFGNPLISAYGTDLKSRFVTPVYEGIFGLLLSTGRGLIWYALPVSLCLWGFSSFARGHRVVAVFIATLSGSVVLFFSPYLFWNGGGSWGPRFLMPLLPFLMLPALSVIDYVTVARGSALDPSTGSPTGAYHAASLLPRIAVSCVVAFGFIINLLGVVVNFDRYLVLGRDNPSLNWVPHLSPIVGQVEYIRQEARAIRMRLAPPPRTLLYKGGFSVSEGDQKLNELLPRWTTGDGLLEVWPPPGVPLSVTLSIDTHRRAGYAQPTVSLLVNGAPAGVVHTPGRPEYSVVINTVPARIEIRSDTWNPSTLKPGDRNEDLGVLLQQIHIVEGGKPRAYEPVEALPVPPYAARRQWYYDSSQLADIWPAYMLGAGLGSWAMLPLVGIGLLCLLAGRRALRRG